MKHGWSRRAGTGSSVDTPDVAFFIGTISILTIDTRQVPGWRGFRERVNTYPLRDIVGGFLRLQWIDPNSQRPPAMVA